MLKFPSISVPDTFGPDISTLAESFKELTDKLLIVSNLSSQPAKDLNDPLRLFLSYEFSRHGEMFYFSVTEASQISQVLLLGYGCCAQGQ